MKKNYKIFSIVWILIFLVFNAITFIVPNEVMGKTRFDKPLFWVSYVMVSLVLIGQMVISLIFCKKDTAQKKFLGLSLLRESFIALIICAIVGIIFMTLPILPTWIGAILCIFVFAYHIFATIKVTAATSYVEQIDEKVKSQTQFIRMLSADASSLSDHAKTEYTHKLACQVYDAIRYSDPMSNEVLVDYEAAIKNKYNELKEAIINDSPNSQSIADELLLLIKERNAKCKTLK